jgi:hypothetical protein
MNRLGIGWLLLAVLWWLRWWVGGAAVVGIIFAISRF